MQASAHSPHTIRHLLGQVCSLTDILCQVIEVHTAVLKTLDQLVIPHPDRAAGHPALVTVMRVMPVECLPLQLPGLLEKRHQADTILVLFFHRLGPLVATRYRVTNHRLIVERGLRNVEESRVSLDQFNEVLVDVQPGQAWYFAGDLIFKKGDTEVFRLEGVSRPEAFRHVCLKAQVAYSGVEAILAQAAG